MILTRSSDLPSGGLHDFKGQYLALLEEANSEQFFYGTPLDPKAFRQVILHGGNVVGAFEYGTTEFEGRNYYRTNRPYTRKEFRGQGHMREALEFWYVHRRPALSWIDDENVSSIRLFQSLGFRIGRSYFHKNKDGHFYILTHDA
jgi:hypothetical protein